jgi:hypothetical protein
MKTKKATEFSWTGLFIVTAICFFIFSGLLKLINGSDRDSSLFFKTGIVSLLFYALAFINSSTMKPALKKKKSLFNSPAKQD